jgi:SAM-dependent methyltransferase
LARYASEGTTVGIDISAEVLEKAKKLTAETNVPTQGPGSVIYEQGNVLERLAYPDDTFDVVFCCELFGHLPPPEQPLLALTEMRRVLKPGGILAARAGVAQHFYPQSLDLNRLWVQNQARGLGKGVIPADPTGTILPALFRSVGFDADGGKVRVGAGAKVFSGSETRKRLTWRAAGQLQKGDPFHQSWLDAGITEDEIQQTLVAVKEWAETEDAWFAILQCEMLAWK